MSSKINIAGHPIHPMLIAYPVAGYTGALVGFCLYGAIGLQFWLNFAIAMNVVGVGGALLAALPGIADAVLGIPGGVPAKLVAIAHGGLNVVSLLLFGATLGYYAGNWNGPPISAVLGIVLSASGLVVTVSAGFLGWMLVQNYHMGVQLSANQQQDEPAVLQQRVLHMPHFHRAA
jgi:uncharacterized membrane protein